MKCISAIVFIFALTAASALKDAEDEGASPVAKVIQLLDGMAEKVKSEESSAAATLKESNEFCKSRNTELGYSIKTGKSNVEKFSSRIEKASMKIDEFADSIQESMGKSEADQADLQAAMDVRAKEKKDFEAEVKELKSTMSTLEKATLVLQKGAMGSKAESLLQVQQAPNVLKAVETMVSASMISAQDAAGLTSLLQKAQAEDEEFQAPVGPAYEKKAGGVLELIENLYDKTKEQLTAIQDKEEQALHNYGMLTKSLQDAIDFSKKEVLKAKAAQRGEQKTKSEAERNLKQTTENLNKDETELVDLGRDCKRKNEDYAIEKADRDAELKAVATAKEALEERAMGASKQQYGLVEEPAFLQIGKKSMIRTGADLANVEVVHMIRNLAHQQHSKELALLAQKIGAVMRTGKSRGPEVLKKIIQMIKDMVASMENRLNEDTTKKAYCDSERAKVKDKKAEKQDQVDEYQAKMDGIASQSAQFKADVQQLQNALAELAGAKKDMMQIREQEKAAFDKNAPEMAAGLEGVKTALKVLREYFESTGKRGGATGIIGMLEVCESDFSKSLSDMKTAEATAIEDYEKELKEMKIEKTRKEADVKYKTEAADTLDRDLIAVKADADTVGEEMAAIIEYSNGIEGECAETKESFAEKAAKRQAEIDGLKTALETLKVENEPTPSPEDEEPWSLKVKVRYAESLAQQGKSQSLRGRQSHLAL